MRHPIAMGLVGVAVAATGCASLPPGFDAALAAHIACSSAQDAMAASDDQKQQDFLKSAMNSAREAASKDVRLWGDLAPTVERYRQALSHIHVVFADVGGADISEMEQVNPENSSADIQELFHAKATLTARCVDVKQP